MMIRCFDFGITCIDFVDLYRIYQDLISFNSSGWQNPPISENYYESDAISGGMGEVGGC